MKDQEKHCNTCASSYYQEEKNVNGGKDMVRMQHCSDPRYNSPVYTNQMLLEDWGNGCCRFWTPIPEKGNDYENNYSIAQRNAIVEDHLWCIDSIIQKNRPLMRAARLEYDDVYQQLAIRLIKAVAGYDPDKGNLQQHIFAQLKYELLNCKAAFRLCGMTGAPRGFQKSDIISLDIVSENSELHEQLLTA